MPKPLRLLAPLLLLLSLAPAVLAGQPAAADQVTLGPGDVLRISIWREQELSGDFQVDESGRVVLPMLGVRRVAGVPMAALRDSLMRDYLRQLRNPSITITPLRRINILGEVGRPGLYPVDPTITLLDALALAGGAALEGDLNRVSLVREGQSVTQRLAAGVSLDALDVRSGDQIVVGRRSWGSRNSPTLVASLISLAGAIATTLIILSAN